MTGAQHKVVGIGFGIAAAYAVVKGQGDSTGAAIAIGAIAGLWIPDIDHNKTKLGRKRKAVTDTVKKIYKIGIYGGIVASIILALLSLKGVITTINPIWTLVMSGVLYLLNMSVNKISNSEGLKWACKHRGLMHTLLFPALFLLLSNMINVPLYHYLITGVNVGYISHLFADMLTIHGCPILWPLTTKNIRIMKLTSGKANTWRAAWFLAISACVLSFILTTGGIV